MCRSFDSFACEAGLISDLSGPQLGFVSDPEHTKLNDGASSDCSSSFSSVMGDSDATSEAGSDSFSTSSKTWEPSGNTATEYTLAPSSIEHASRTVMTVHVPESRLTQTSASTLPVSKVPVTFKKTSTYMSSTHTGSTTSCTKPLPARLGAPSPLDRNATPAIPSTAPKIPTTRYTRTSTNGKVVPAQAAPNKAVKHNAEHKAPRPWCISSKIGTKPAPLPPAKAKPAMKTPISNQLVKAAAAPKQQTPTMPPNPPTKVIQQALNPSLVQNNQGRLGHVTAGRDSTNAKPAWKRQQPTQQTGMPDKAPAHVTTSKGAPSKSVNTVTAAPKMEDQHIPPLIVRGGKAALWRGGLENPFAKVIVTVENSGNHFH